MKVDVVCLILDTSTNECLLGLAKDGHLFDQKIFTHQNFLSKLLLPEIQALLHKNDLSAKDLGSLAIGIGPGSYTGTRVGVSVGKSLAFGLNISLQTFASPLAFIPPQIGTFLFLMPTRSGSVFTLKGSASSDSLCQESVQLFSPQLLSKPLKDACFCVGPQEIASLVVSQGKSLFAPTLNLPLLCRFLLSKEPTLPENVELLYLQNLS